MYRFEKSMYENPDQDLNKLWWDLKSKYQLLKKPEGHNSPDWAAKIHTALYPIYYPNYILGYLFTEQLSNYIKNNVGKEFGPYLIDKVFKPGRKCQWNELIEHATGEKLTAKYFARKYL
jgi:peptidyl-dipeptidase A